MIKPFTGLFLGSIFSIVTIKAFAQDNNFCKTECVLKENCHIQEVAHQCYQRCDAIIGSPCMHIYISKNLKIPNKLNTSNMGKLGEFQGFFKQYQHDIVNTTFDLDEIDSDPISVIVQKASAVNNGKGGVLVEDTSLDIDGENVGVNIRWLLSNLDKFAGKNASWTVMLAFREGDIVFVSTGVIKGKIVAKRGSEGFGFDPYFMPDGHNATLAEIKSNEVNARAIAVNALMSREFIAIQPAIDSWEGDWQKGE